MSSQLPKPSIVESGLDVNTLAMSVSRLYPFFKTCSHYIPVHPRLDHILYKIAEQEHACQAVLECSLDAALEGTRLCQSGIALCDKMRQEEEIPALAQEMMNVSREARTRAAAVQREILDFIVVIVPMTRSVVFESTVVGDREAIEGVSEAVFHAKDGGAMVSSDLSRLIHWWHEIEDELRVLQGAIPDLRKGRMGRLDVMRRRWESVEKLCTLYCDGIVSLLEGNEGEQDHELTQTSSSSLPGTSSTTPPYHGVLQLNSPIRPYQEKYLDDLSSALLSSFHSTANPGGRISLSRAALELLPTSHPLRLYFLHSLNDLLFMRFQQCEEMSDLDEAIERGREAFCLIPTSDPDRFSYLTALMEAVSTRFHKTCETVDLVEAISLHKEALGSTSSSSDRPGLLNNLGYLFSAKFERESQIADLDQAILMYREALGSGSHPYQVDFLYNLGKNLWMRFNETGETSDIEEAILLFRSGLELLGPSHPSRPKLINGLGAALKHRFDHTPDVENINEAITLHRSVLELLPQHLQLDSLNNLANALCSRFHHTHQVSDIEEAIVVRRLVLESLPSPHPQRPLFLSNMSTTLCDYFDYAGQIEDLQEAVSLLRAALEQLPDDHPELPSHLNNLANSLELRARHTGDISDLDEAASFYRAAVELLPTSHPHHPQFQRNLASAFSNRFNLSGQTSDIDEAISWCREARRGSLSAVHQSDVLGDLGHSLWRRFENTGQMSDLDESILLHRVALELQPTSYALRERLGSNLANALMLRFNHTHQMSDIDEAISLLQTALNLEPNPNTSRRCRWLNNLSNAIYGRFNMTQQLLDLNEVLSLRRETLALSTVTQPEHLAYLNNIADTLYKRFLYLHQISDLNESISYLREAQDLHLGHPNHILVLNNLSMGFQTLFDQTHSIEHITEAISLSRDALYLLPQDHPKTCLISASLGSGLRRLYDQDQKREYLDQVADAFRAGVTSEFSPTFTRFIAARHWAMCADGTHDSALEAYGIAIRLLPRLAMLGLDLESRHKALAQEISTRGLPSGAAACAISTNQIDKAVELLEEGRSIFWSQALHLRTPLDELKAQHNDLGNKLENLSRALESGSFRETLRTLEDASQKVVSMEQEAVHFRRLNEEWTSTLEEIRRLDGFHDFLLPKKLPELQRATVNGPVVILNISTSRCDALILTQSGVQHVPLPALTIELVEELFKQTRYYPNISYRGTNDRHFIGIHREKTSDGQFKDILATLWTAVAEPVIRSLKLKKSKAPPRLWWCPTGLLAFLPIHAAGIYNAEDMEDGECVFNYVTSSYTPTLSTLLSPPASSDGNFEMMSIIQPETPGLLSLPCTRDELLMIERHVPPTSLVKLGGPDSAPATVETVLARLPSASIVHFACHGIQNAVNPLDSAIVLENGQLTVARIMQQPLPKADLAFLSACQTAMGDEDSPDEAIHIAATLLFAGFRGAVATMWSIADEDGPKVSDYFYGELFKGNSGFPINSLSHPDTTHAAHALHAAVSRMRDEGIPFERWVPFIHMGL